MSVTRKTNFEMVFFIIALIVLVAGVFVTIYTSTPVFEPETISMEEETLSTTNIMQGLVTIEVVDNE